jgi:hypothetical protein
MVLVTYIRRFSATLTALSTHLSELSERYELPELETFAWQTNRALAELAEAIQQGCPPRELPSSDTVLNQIHFRELYRSRVTKISEKTTVQQNLLDSALLVSTLLDRLVDEIRVMRSALARICG